MPGGQPDVLVEVEGGDAVPGDFAVGAQGGQELVLRGSGGEDRGGAALASDRLLQVIGDRRCRRPSQGGAIRVHLDLETAAREYACGHYVRGRRRGPQDRGGPPREVGQRDLRLLDVRVPSLLPLERDPPSVPAVPQQREHRGGAEVTAAGKPRRPPSLLPARTG